MNSRRVSKELEVQIRGINRNAPSVPPNSTTEEKKQVNYLRFFKFLFCNLVFRWSCGKNILLGKKAIRYALKTQLCTLKE